MLEFLKEMGKKIGVDKSIAYSSGARIIQAFTGVVSIFFISTFLTNVEQGFYYTFGSIIALQVFFELGLTGIITQYVAHEASHLKWVDQIVMVGEAKYLSRLASLLRFSVKWYAVISVFFCIGVFIAGSIFFQYYTVQTEDISWRLPWLMVCLGSSLSLFLQPVLAILMGLGRVKEVSKISFYQQIIMPSSMWFGLILGAKLYVVGLSSLIVALWISIYILSTDFKSILWNLWKIRVNERVDYIKEIFPYQWKIALSWVSGYFIFQLFNPVLFAIEGPIVAGQMGMTLAALNGIQALSLSWLNTKVPLYSSLIAIRDYVQLNNIFNKTLKQMTLVCLVLLVIMFVGVWGLRTFNLKLGYRFLDYFPMLLLMIPLFINQFVNSWATYLRCHKQEPFLINSICAGIACCVSTVVFGNFFGLYGITCGYCIITIIFMPWAYSIFENKRKVWHRI